ncbi:flagellar basal body-associated FliL family protein [Pisciglobus halotolerans]|uniref:Flagellar protein FliL n=1 Tax=Pisciglobus halotolerans TaxID=745365 RepID=A0A1I3ANS2_9LACT|nr:flagellar basal body-associated FliL family protein [Pisciglobus halotolerans]SFH51379.1 flagellar FliL protein [Pisciglobus halotolerans]
MKESGKTDNKLKKILIVVIILLVLSVGSLLGIGLKSGKAKEMVEAAMNPEVETTVPLEEFLVNLDEDKAVGSQYLKIELSVYSMDKEAEKLLTENAAQVRDAVITVLHSQTPETIFKKDQSGSLIVKHEIVEKINDVLEQPIVQDVYITNIVVQ